MPFTGIIISRTNSEVLVSNGTDRLCLMCGEFTDTDWQLLYNNELRILQNGETIFEIAEVINGMVIFLNPYQLLVNNQFFTSCVGTFGLYDIIVYSTELLPPMISLPPVNVRKEGSLFIATCVHLNPSLFGISITWLDQDEKEVASNGTLIIRPLSRRNKGTFTCVLKKSENEVLTESILLSIQYADSEDAAAIHLPLGEDLYLSCEYNYIPHPLTVSWETIHQRILQGLEGVNITTVGNRTDLSIAHDSTLLINETTYACFQRDFNGQIYLPFLVGRIPESVEEFIATLVSAFSISLSWEYQANGSSPRSGAEVDIFDVFDKLVRMDTIAFSATEVTLTSLMPSTSYIMRMYSVNRVGRSPPAFLEVSTLSHDPMTPDFILFNVVLTRLIPTAGGILVGIIGIQLANLCCIGYKRQAISLFGVKRRKTLTAGGHKEWTGTCDEIHSVEQSSSQKHRRDSKLKFMRDKGNVSIERSSSRKSHHSDHNDDPVSSKGNHDSNMDEKNDENEFVKYPIIPEMSSFGKMITTSC